MQLVCWEATNLPQIQIHRMDRIERLKEFLHTAPTDLFVLHALGLEYIKIGNELLAQQQFEQVLLLDEGYIGSYYHLAKLFERTGQEEAAIATYQKGMDKAKAAGDNHALSELRSAFEELTF